MFAGKIDVKNVDRLSLEIQRRLFCIKYFTNIIYDFCFPFVIFGIYQACNRQFQTGWQQAAIC